MKIKDILAKGQPTLSFEVFPPKEESNFASVEKAALEIAKLNPSFMSVTYGAGGADKGCVSRLYGPDRIGYPEHLPGAGAVTSDLRLLDP